MNPVNMPPSNKPILKEGVVSKESIKEQRIVEARQQSGDTLKRADKGREENESGRDIDAKQPSLKKVDIGLATTKESRMTQEQLSQLKVASKKLDEELKNSKIDEREVSKMCDTAVALGPEGVAFLKSLISRSAPERMDVNQLKSEKDRLRGKLPADLKLGAEALVKELHETVSSGGNPFLRPSFRAALTSILAEVAKLHAMNREMEGEFVLNFISSSYDYAIYSAELSKEATLAEATKEKLQAVGSGIKVASSTASLLSYTTASVQANKRYEAVNKDEPEFKELKSYENTELRIAKMEQIKNPTDDQVQADVKQEHILGATNQNSYLVDKQKAWQDQIDADKKFLDDNKDRYSKLMSTRQEAIGRVLNTIINQTDALGKVNESLTEMGRSGITSQYTTEAAEKNAKAKETDALREQLRAYMDSSQESRRQAKAALDEVIKLLEDTSKAESQVYRMS